MLIFFVILSFLYENLFEESLTLEIPTPSGKVYKLSFSKLELIEMSINGVLKNINIKRSLSNPYKVRLYVKRINKEILKYKTYYDFYYLEFQKFYPERYFILCISNSCDYFFFSTSGLISVNESEVDVKEPLIIWIDEDYLNGFLKCLDEHCDVLTYLKKVIIEGKFKVKNAKKIVDRILTQYKFTPQRG